MRGNLKVTKQSKSCRLVCLLLTVILTSSALTFIQLTNVQPVYANPTISNKGMLVYGEGTVATPRYRNWTGSALASEQTGPTMAATIQYAVLKSCPMDRPPAEKMLVISEDAGDVIASVWSNSTGWGTPKTLGSAILQDDASRGFHVAYEQLSADAMIVVRSGTDVKYWIWDGSSWTVDGTTLDLTVTTGNPLWIKLAADPLSDEIAMIWLADSNQIGGAIWDGSAWGSQQLLESGTTVITTEMMDKEGIAVEYMSSNGKAMFAWCADDKPTADDSGIGTRVWNGASWDSTAYIGTGIGRDGYPPFWLSLKANPNSNELMLLETDDDSDLQTVRWSGTAWDSPVEHSLGIRTETSRCGDVEWENITGHTTHAIVAFGISSDELTTIHWDGSSWGTPITTDPYTDLTDQYIVQLRRLDADGKIVVSMVDSAGDLHVWYWNSATQAWVYSGTDLGQIATGVSGGTLYEPFEFAPDLHEPFTPPPYSTVYVDPDSIVDTGLTPETTLVLRPNGAGTYTDWFGAYTDWDEADPHDGDGSYVYATAATYSEDAHLSDLVDSTSEAWDIGGVRVTIVVRATHPDSNEKVYPALYIVGWPWGPEWGKACVPTTTYGKYTSEWAVNPGSGDFWTWDDIDDLEAGVVLEKIGSWPTGNEIRVTQLYVEVFGPRFTVDIKIDWVEDLYLFEFELFYDQNVINGVYFNEGLKYSIEIGPFLASAGGSIAAIPGPWDNTLGKLKLSGAYLPGETPGSPKLPSGRDGHLATVYFCPVRKGETEIRIGNGTSVTTPQGGPIIDFRLEHGYFRNVDANQIPTADFDVTAVSTPVPLQGYYTNFDNDSTPASGSGSPISTCKWYFWDVYHERLHGFTNLILRPNGAGTDTGWTGTWQDWDEETADGDASYVKADADAQYETTQLQNHATQAWNIGGVRVSITARTNVATDERVQLLLRIGGTRYLGDSYLPTTTYARYEYEWATNPSTGNAWTWSEIDALEAGVKSVQEGGSWTGEIRVTQLYITVLQTATYTSVDTITRNFTRRGTWNVTLTVIDDNGVVGTNDSYATILSHDIYFTGIHTNATRGAWPPGQYYFDLGEDLEINATVINEGDFTETFDVTTWWSIYYQGEDHRVPIGTNTGVTLAAGVAQNETFIWHTTGLYLNVSHPNFYAIHANASRVTYEYDTEPDPAKIAPNEFIGEGIRVRFTDVAVISVQLNATNVNEGDTVEVAVTVENQGDHNLTDITVKAYYDSTEIDTLTIHLLTNESFGVFPRFPVDNFTKTLLFNWTTTGVGGGTFTIKADASIGGTTGPAEYDETDNEYIDGTVTITSAVPVFPLGAAMEIALAAAVIYLWWRRKHRPNNKESTFSNP